MPPSVIPVLPSQHSREGGNLNLEVFISFVLFMDSPLQGNEKKISIGSIPYESRDGNP
jgi:hypothetical protein